MKVTELLAVGIEPLTGLAVGEEAVTWSGLGRALERGLGKGKHHRYAQSFNPSPESEKRTFAVGIWTAMEGVGSRPEAEGWIAGGGIGLNAPCRTITTNLTP